MAAMAVPKVAPPFQGSRFWMSSVNRTTPSGSCPISSGFHSCRVASTEGTSHSPLPSPQPTMPASVVIFRKSQGLAVLEMSSPVVGSRISWPVGTENL